MPTATMMTAEDIRLMDRKQASNAVGLISCYIFQRKMVSVYFIGWYYNYLHCACPLQVGPTCSKGAQINKLYSGQHRPKSGRNDNSLQIQHSYSPTDNDDPFSVYIDCSLNNDEFLEACNCYMFYKILAYALISLLRYMLVVLVSNFNKVRTLKFNNFFLFYTHRIGTEPGAVLQVRK